jgi:ABC-type multidrug transport system ATPase subunit
VADSILNVRGAGKTIRRQTILQPLDLELSKGEAIALCGGNGAGKSTMLRMIVGVMQPTVGAIEVLGLNWRRSRPAYAAALGYMPDDFNFGSALTAWETIRFYASLKGVSDERALEVLKLVDLADVRGKKVSAFSKGMRQRLLFAQALLAKPPLLVLDEPTNGLDPYWTETFAKLVLQLKAEGQAIVFSTHQLDVAETVADEAVFLDKGRTLGRGAVSAFKQTYGERGLFGAFAELVLGRTQGDEAI